MENALDLRKISNCMYANILGNDRSCAYFADEHSAVRAISHVIYGYIRENGPIIVICAVNVSPELIICPNISQRILTRHADAGVLKVPFSILLFEYI